MEDGGLLGISCASNFRGASSPAGLAFSDAVRRVPEGAGVKVLDKSAWWLGLHMERFLEYARIGGELFASLSP